MTDRHVLIPTHTCFDDAVEFLFLCVKGDDLAASDRLRIVHAIAHAPGGEHAGEPFAHAWVEDGDLCWFAGVLEGQRIFVAAARDEFYAELKIHDATYYTLADAAREELRTGECGPWKPKYQALCGRGDRKVYR